MQQTMIQLEKDMIDYFTEVEDDARQKMLDAGVEYIKFSPADAKWYVDTAYQVFWDVLLERCPDTAPRLRELSGN